MHPEERFLGWRTGPAGGIRSGKRDAVVPDRAANGH
jgi:hypothetical protein